MRFKHVLCMVTFLLSSIVFVFFLSSVGISNHGGANFSYELLDDDQTANNKASDNAQSSNNGLADDGQANLRRNYSISRVKKPAKITDIETAANSHLRIVYNRVPKCGSRSILTLFKTLAVKNGFKVMEPGKNYPYALDLEEQKNISTLLSSLKPPFVYHRHVHYINFKRFGGPPVAYINLIRDPVSRAVSHFYFRRNGDGILAKSRAGTPVGGNINMTYDECVLTKHAECNNNWGRFFVVPFFCGHIKECRVPTRWALLQAMSCVKRNYLVVGVVEEYDDFVKALEKLLPRFFKGAYKTWKVPDTRLQSKAIISKTREKKQPSENAVAVAKKRMALEYEFYNFVKERFHALKKDLGI